MKLKKKGGSGGHRGIQSIVEALETEHFSRVKMGIGRPEGDQPCDEFVLSPFAADQMSPLQEFLIRGAEALESIVLQGIDHAMNFFNRGLS